MDHVVSFVFDTADILLNPPHSFISVVEPCNQKLRGSTKDLAVALKKLKKSFVLR